MDSEKDGDDLSKAFSKTCHSGTLDCIELVVRYVFEQTRDKVPWK